MSWVSGPAVRHSENWRMDAYEQVRNQAILKRKAAITAARREFNDDLHQIEALPANRRDCCHLLPDVLFTFAEIHNRRSSARVLEKYGPNNVFIWRELVECVVLDVEPRSLLKPHLANYLVCLRVGRLSLLQLALRNSDLQNRRWQGPTPRGDPVAIAVSVRLLGQCRGSPPDERSAVRR
jgi:hypothetical protein